MWRYDKRRGQTQLIIHISTSPHPGQRTHGKIERLISKKNAKENTGKSMRFSQQSQAAGLDSSIGRSCDQVSYGDGLHWVKVIIEKWQLSSGVNRGKGWEAVGAKKGWGGNGVGSGGNWLGDGNRQSRKWWVNRAAMRVSKPTRSACHCKMPLLR